MLTRQKILLCLLSDLGSSATKIILFRLAFLLSQQGKSECLRTFYEFLPYLCGPYSFTLNYELDRLQDVGAISLSDNDRIELTATGHQIVEQHCATEFLQDLKLLKREYGGSDRNFLIQQVDEKFPWFTINETTPPKRKTERIKAKCANYTIGYQDYQVDGLLNVLLENGIDRLVDTRWNPVSRRYGFHKSTLYILCSKLQIDYVHAPQFGIPSSWRQNLETDRDYENLFGRYEIEVLNGQQVLLNKLANEMKEVPSALLCREQDHHQCHRSRLAKRLATLNGLPVHELRAVYARAI